MFPSLFISALALAAPAGPVPVIFDTDMDTDVDDVGALAILHALADAGEARILAVVHSAPAQDGPVCAQAVNAWYGREGLPVGWTDWPELATSPVYELYRRARKHIVDTGAEYTPTVAAAYRARKGGETPPVRDGVTLYRETLAAAEDGSVVICTVGMLTAVAGLLESGPDDISPLSGRDLVAKKVRLLVTMALGDFPEGRDGFNWKCDVPSAAKVINQWPVALAVMPHGETILTGGRLAHEGAPENPCARAYDIYVKTPEKNRSSWDLCTVLYGVRGPAPFFKDKPGHRLEMDAEAGTHRWVPDADAPHVFIEQVGTDADIAACLDELLLRAPRR